MAKKLTIYDDIKKTLAGKNIQVQVGDMYDFIDIWKSWYRGNVNNFHFYKAKLPDGKTVECERLTMNMAKKVCEDYAKLLWSEKVEINLSNKKATARLWEVLDSKENNFSKVINEFIEKTFALSTGAIVEFQDNGKTVIDFVSAEHIIPYKFSNGYISGIVIMDQKQEGKEFYTHLTYHEFDNGVYFKYNELYKSEDKNKLGDEIAFATKYPGVQEVVIEITEVPHFQILKANIVNNFDLETPMGISIYANQIDKLKSLDTKYDSFNQEFELGKKRILVDKSALKPTATINTDGSTSNAFLFDKNDKVFQAINGMDGQPVKEIDFKLRVEEHVKAINSDLNFLSAGVGLGQDFYSFDMQGGIKTTTEVVSENSDTYRSKVNHQILLREAIIGMVKAICYLEGIATKEIIVKFDDSIIEDQKAKIERGMTLVEKGLLSKKKFLIDYMEYTEEEAQTELDAMAEQNKLILPEGADFFGGQNTDNAKQEPKQPIGFKNTEPKEDPAKEE